MIDPDTGARELGVDKWFNKDLIPKEKGNEEKPKSRVDESEQPVEPENKPDKDKKKD